MGLSDRDIAHMSREEKKQIAASCVTPSLLDHHLFFSLAITQIPSLVDLHIISTSSALL